MFVNLQTTMMKIIYKIKMPFMKIDYQKEFTENKELIFVNNCVDVNSCSIHESHNYSLKFNLFRFDAAQ